MYPPSQFHYKPIKTWKWPNLEIANVPDYQWCVSTRKLPVNFEYWSLYSLSLVLFSESWCSLFLDWRGDLAFVWPWWESGTYRWPWEWALLLVFSWIFLSLVFHSFQWRCLTIPSLVVKGSVVQKIPSGQMFIDILKFCHDLVFEHTIQFLHKTLVYNNVLSN